MKKTKNERLVKTTIQLPEDLWKKVKIKALDAGEGNLRTVIIHALDLYLKQGGIK